MADIIVAPNSPSVLGSWRDARTETQDPALMRERLLPPALEQSWNLVYDEDFTGQSTGIPPVGTTERYRTVNRTDVVEADGSMTGGRRFRMATGSNVGTSDALRSIDVLDDEPNVRIRMRARATNVGSSPWSLKFRASGTAGGLANQHEYSVTLVVSDTANEMRLHRNDPTGNPTHVHLVTVTDQFVTFEGDDTPTLTEHAAFDELVVNAFFWLDAWVINNQINYKFWLDGTPEPTAPGQNWIQHTDAQAKAKLIGGWNGPNARRNNVDNWHIDILQGFILAT